MSITSDYLKNVKATLATRAAARAAIKHNDMVTVSGIDGVWRVRNTSADVLTLVKQRDGKDWQGMRSFDRSRCNPAAQ